MKSLTLFASLLFSATFGFADPTTLASLKGVYVFTERGDVGNGQAVAGLGIMTLDGNGNVTCSETIQTEGSNMTTTCSGTYVINIDGSATVKLMHTITPDPNAATTDDQTFSASYKILATANGSQLKGIRTDNGISVIADFTK